MGRLLKVHAQGETSIKLFKQQREKRKHESSCLLLLKSAPLEMAFYENHLNMKDSSGQWICFKKAHVICPRLKVTFYLSINGVKKNPSSPLYTTLVITTKGNVNDKDVSKLGLVTQRGKGIWEKYVQVTNNPENDGS